MHSQPHDRIISKTMKVLFLLSILICIFYGKVVENEKIDRKVDDVDIIKAAEFAVHELRLLSDSGIYESLHLQSILHAASQVGVFHDNLFLTLRLGCLHFESGLKYENFEIMVMEHFDNKEKSFSIDRFPKLKESAVEEYWIKMVEAKRKDRKQHFEQFQQLEVEMAQDMEYLRGLKIFELRKLERLESTSAQVKENIQNIIQERWSILEKMETIGY